MTDSAPPALAIEGLRVSLPGDAEVVRQATLTIGPGEAVGLVGESGSGKTMLALAVMGLLPARAEVTATRLDVVGLDTLVASKQERRAARGRDVAMVFQDPMSSLNPYLSVGAQLRETLAVTRAVRGPRATELAIAALQEVGIAAPADRLGSYPHQLSGGMCQRVMVAQALLGQPQLLVADEPTTALDATIQAQLLALISGLCRLRGMALLLISHDLGVVAQVADRVAVMYAGEIVEVADRAAIFAQPAHPYTAALLRSRPATQARGSRLATIHGTVPAATARPTGCAFAPRCTHQQPACHRGPLPLRATSAGGMVRCVRADEWVRR